MKIKIDNTHGSDFLALVTGSWEEAQMDQTIAGSKWEHAGDDFAYAVINNVPGLVKSLEVEGYDVDDGEFYPISNSIEVQEESKCLTE